MSTHNSGEKWVTAKELMDQLNQDPEYIARMKRFEEEHRELIELHRRALAGVINELRVAGFAIETLDELRRSGKKYVAAVPILLKWLPLVTVDDAKDSVVRTLSVPWARPVAAIPLIEAFREATNDRSLKWAIGNALSVVADDSVFDEIADLARNKEYGKAREMVAVALGNMKDQRAVEVLIDLLGDEEVVGHAVMGLGKLRAKSARSQIERLVNHPKAWIRKEAKRALAKIDKAKEKNG
jgi:hypothetical protein